MQPPASNSIRVVVIGSSCAGKTTFARLLAEAVGWPRIELDELYWSSDWTPKPESEFKRLVQEAAAGDCWVADGNYALCRGILWPRATTIVWLNYGLTRVLWRGLRRTCARCFRGEILYHGNRETIQRSFFSKDSILLWIISTFGRRRREFSILRKSGAFSHLTWLEARCPTEAHDLLVQLKNAS
jgi:adenylate kinase family enzyme